MQYMARRMLMLVGADRQPTPVAVSLPTLSCDVRASVISAWRRDATSSTDLTHLHFTLFECHYIFIDLAYRGVPILGLCMHGLGM